MRKALLPLLVASTVVGAGCLMATSSDQQSEWLVVSRGGSLIATDPAGRMEQEIAPPAQQARFAGTSRSDEGHWVYYVPVSQRPLALWKYNLETGEADIVLSSEQEPLNNGDVAISPDSRYLVIPSEDVVRLFDFEAGASIVVLTADAVLLELLGWTPPSNSADSVAFHSVIWLPDSKGFQIEGSRPGGAFRAVVALVEDQWRLGVLPVGWDWLPGENLSCWAQAGPNPPVIYQVSIRRDPQPSPPVTSIVVPGTDCAWLDSGDVAFTVPMVDPGQSQITLPSVSAALPSKNDGMEWVEATIPAVGLLEPDTGEVTLLALLLDKDEARQILLAGQSDIWQGLQLMELPDDKGVVTFGEDLQPLLLRLDGEVEPILQRGDLILAVTARGSG